MRNKRRPLTSAEAAAAVNLRRIWDDKKKALGLSQQRAADEMGWTQGAVYQYLNAVIPLNLEATLKFSGVLHVSATEIDPSIAERFPHVRLGTEKTDGGIPAGASDAISALIGREIPPSAALEELFWLIAKAPERTRDLAITALVLSSREQLDETLAETLRVAILHASQAHTPGESGTETAWDKYLARKQEEHEK